MVKADSHKVRIKFDHGNSMSLDLKGCGSIYIEPGKDYFFENAPMQFINYLSQLRRLGVTYRLTDDKKGCYMTIDLSGYQTNEPKTILGQLRSNLVQTSTPVVRYETIEDSDIDESTVEDLIPAGTFKEDIKEVKIENTIEPKKETLVNPELELTEDDLDDDESIKDNKTTEVVEDETSDKPEKEETVKPVTDEELEAMNKTKLIDYAKSLGLNEVSEIWTKKELRTAIKEKLSE